MPPLKIPSTTDKRILQTDASDEYWGAVLLVECTGKSREICGYKSGTFKTSEQHYHSTFKEILAVKRGIEKFQFHLVGHCFEIEMDMSSFPRMLQFKQKTLPESQLLRWANWFSQWKFTVKHIKGKDNILADLLSRPRAYKSKIKSESKNPSKSIQMVFSIHPSSSSLPPEASSSEHPPPDNNLHSQLPEEVVEIIADLTLKERAAPNHNTFLTILLRKHGLFMHGLQIHPDYPFLNIFHIHDLSRFPKEALCFFWYLFEAHTIAISFNSVKLLSYILQCQFDEANPPGKNLYKMLTWFLPAHQWLGRLSICCKTYVVIMFRRPCSFIPPALVRRQPQGIVYHHPLSFIHEWSDYNPANPIPMENNPQVYLKIRYALAHANMFDPQLIPTQIMHSYVSWSDDHPVSSKWMEAFEDWKRNHLEYDYIETSEEEDSPDDEEYESPLHSDPYEDDPSHPDSRWK